MGEKNKFLPSYFFSFVILLVTQKLNFFEENFKIKTSPPFLLVDHILPLGLAEIRKNVT